MTTFRQFLIAVVLILIINTIMAYRLGVDDGKETAEPYFQYRESMTGVEICDGEKWVHVPIYSDKSCPE